MSVVRQMDFGDWCEEARAIRSGLAAVELDHLSALRLSGREARDFLHRMTTADLKRVPPGRAVPTALLTPKARVICTMTAVLLPDEVLCLLPQDYRDSVRAYLDRFIIADDVEVADDERVVLGVYGTGLEQSAVLGDLARLEAYRLKEVAPLQVECFAIGDDHLATPGAQLILHRGEREQLVEQLTQKGVRRAGWRAYDSCRIEAGTPQMGRELSEDVLILEAGQLIAVSFDKGCYPGQEPVCRTHQRGQLNRRLVGLRLDIGREPETGEALRHGDKADAGWITSTAHSVHVGQRIGLGYVHRRVMAAGTLLELEHGGQAEVCALPHVVTDV